MKKTKIIALLLAIAMSVLIFPMSASAISPDVDVDCSTQERIPTEKEAKALILMVDAANNTIYAAVKWAQFTPYNDVKPLLALVNTLAYSVFAYADYIGAEVACEYEEYEIDGQMVMVDPLRVINIPAGGGGGHSHEIN